MFESGQVETNGRIYEGPLRSELGNHRILIARAALAKITNRCHRKPFRYSPSIRHPADRRQPSSLITNGNNDTEFRRQQICWSASASLRLCPPTRHAGNRPNTTEYHRRPGPNKNRYGLHGRLIQTVIVAELACSLVAFASDNSRNSFHMSRQFVSPGTKRSIARTL